MSIVGWSGADPEQASGVLQPFETLDDVSGAGDVLDTGWSPPDRPWAVQAWGMTHREERAGESLSRRLGREVPEFVDPGGDGLGDTSDTDGELIDEEVGYRPAGRLVEICGARPDVEPETYAYDAGIDGAGASAEEAAVHLVPEADEDWSWPARG
jgi:hypothetical protein